MLLKISIQKNTIISSIKSFNSAGIAQWVDESRQRPCLSRGHTQRPRTPRPRSTSCPPCPVFCRPKRGGPRATAQPGAAAAPRQLTLWARRQADKRNARASPNPDNPSDSRQQYFLCGTGPWIPRYPALAAPPMTDHEQDAVPFPCPWGMLTHTDTQTQVCAFSWLR